MLKNNNNSMVLRMSEFIQKVIKDRQVVSNHEFNQRLDAFVEQHKAIVEEGRASTGNARVANKNNLEASISQLKSDYQRVWNDYQRFINEYETIAKIDRSAHMRAIIARVFTTLGIGFSIMLVYYLAHKWGVPMPTLKLPS